MISLQLAGSMLANGDSLVKGSQALYGPFYGLREAPFALSPDPRFLCLPKCQREALSNLRYGLSSPRGFTLLIGDAGTGKTTLVQAVLAELYDSKTRCVVLSNPTLGRTEFYDFLARGFGLSEAARSSKTQLLSELQPQVQERFATGGLTGLIIDEAQSLSDELLEELRLLGNLETLTAKLLNIVLSGQPELADRLNEPALRQLKQRVTLRCELTALDLEETTAYIAGRLRTAGGSPGEVLTRESVVAIHELSGGLPRTINVLCDNALLGGFAEQVKPVPVEIVEQVGRDFDLRRDITPRDVGPVNGSLTQSRGVPAPGGGSNDPGSETELSAERLGTRAPMAPMFEAFGSKRRFSFF